MMDFTTLKKLNIGGIDLVQLFINGVQEWKSGPKNWVKYSTEADGVTIYNGGLGYLIGKRLSSSGVLKDATLATVTGYIPATGGDTVRIAGMKWYNVESGSNYICAYDKEFNYLGCMASSSYNYGYNGVVVNSSHSGELTGDDTLAQVTLVSTEIAYIRVSGLANPAVGAGLIVTINEEIAA